MQGSGLSEGQWVTLGAHEQDDVEVAVAHLRATGNVSTIGLWGRSMGAVTALLYSQRDPSIAGMVGLPPAHMHARRQRNPMHPCTCGTMGHACMCAAMAPSCEPWRDTAAPQGAPCS